MKILFTAPRFHTNQALIVKGLIEKGHEVRYLVVYEGAIEDHRFCQPDILKPSRETLRRWIKLSRKESESEVESIIGGSFVPDYMLLKEKIKKWLPDIVICRSKTNLTLCVNNICIELHIPCILYDQEPVFARRNISEQLQKPVHSTGVIRKYQIKTKRMLSADQCMLRKFQETTGYPDVRMSPVKYRLSDQSNDLIHCSHSYYIPLAYEAPCELKNRCYFSQGIINFLLVGKYREYKNIPILISALGKLKEYENWHLNIVGQSINRDEIEYKKALWYQIVHAGMEKRVSIFENCAYKEMHKVYESSDLLILPSKEETYGMVIVEAMAHGVPVICSDTCGAAFCNAEAGGWIVRQGSVESLTNVLSACIKDSNMIRTIGMSSYNYVKDNLTFEAYFSGLSSLLLHEFKINAVS